MPFDCEEKDKEKEFNSNDGARKKFISIEWEPTFLDNFHSVQ